MNSSVQAPTHHNRAVDYRTQDLLFCNTVPPSLVAMIELYWIETKSLGKAVESCKILTNWFKMVKNLQFWGSLALRVNYIIFYAFLRVVYAPKPGFPRFCLKSHNFCKNVAWKPPAGVEKILHQPRSFQGLERETKLLQIWSAWESHHDVRASLQSGGILACRFP